MTRLEHAVARIQKARFATRLRWQFSVKPWLADQRWLTAHVPWQIWCRLCAWNAESVVRELAKRSSGPLHFVQIGSNDGVANDPLFETVLAEGWTGLAVEPIPRLFEQLTANYRDAPGVRTANVAIGDEDGSTTIYEVRPEPGDPAWVTQIASLDREVVLRHAYALPDLENRIVPTEVESARLPSLLERWDVRSIDVLHIDAEGFDDEIIRQIDMGAPWAPRYLIYEKKHLLGPRYRAIEALLRAAGYRLVDVWPDELAYRPESASS